MYVYMYNLDEFLVQVNENLNTQGILYKHKRYFWP